MPLLFLLIINRIKVLLVLRLCVFDTNVFAFITESNLLSVLGIAGLCWRKRQYWPSNFII